ncbi:hypothetical protein LVO79_17285 [Roseivivax marinus]|uniref:hypothetical protein n=1 Tax=Roseivivax marinus TaxID=1379903 RepID=UPI001F0407C5|nr:hypothetical protein [Roseivivax marinus]UMA64731.1 hypothetical protein LVO79_17285 [Roseivivax marinus]
MTGTFIRAALLAAVAASPALANDYTDPTWPCIQRKVEQLSPGLMWPIDPATVDPEMSEDTARAARELAATLALRRVDLETAEARVAEFTQAHGTDSMVLASVFLDVFDTLSTRRQAVMGGIEHYSLGQIELSERIDGARSEMDTAMEAEDPDFDRVDALEEQIAWDERIYTDRQRTLQYVCETPVLIEKRLFALAQMLQGAAGG